VPKIIGGSLAAHRATTRDRLFGALGRLLRTRPLASITVSDIAAEAGVGRTAVYNHFADRDAILLAYIADQAAQHAARLDIALRDGPDDPAVQLRAYVRAQCLLEHAHHLPGSDVRAMVAPDTAARLREHGTAFGSVLRRILEEGIAAGAFPDQDVPTTVALVNACVTGRRLPHGGPARTAAITATEDFVLRAVGAPTIPQ